MEGHVCCTCYQAKVCFICFFRKCILHLQTPVSTHNKSPISSTSSTTESTSKSDNHRLHRCFHRWHLPANSDPWHPFCPVNDGVLYTPNIVAQRIQKGKKEGCGLHCLVPSYINNTQCSVGKIPFVIPFVLQANSLISLPEVLHTCVSVSACVCVCVSAFSIYLSRCLLIITSAPALFIQMGSITF